MTIRVLLVESDWETAQSIVTALGRYGFDIARASTGAEAIDLFGPDTVDVVVVDVKLGKEDGGEVARSLRAARGGDAVGLCLIVPEEFDRAAAGGFHVDNWFERPLSTRVIRDRLADVAFRYTGATSDLLPRADGAAQRQALRDAPRTPPAGVRAPAVEAAARLAAPAPPVAGRPAEVGQVGLRQVARAASPEERIPTAPPHLVWGRPIAVQNARTVPAALLDLARKQRTGLLHLRHRDSRATVAMLQGVLVGAADNDPSNRLGARLARGGHLDESRIDDVQAHGAKTGLRFAESVLALELCSVDVMLSELVGQAKDRLVLSAGWTDGELTFEEDPDGVARMRVESFDVLEVIQRWFLRLPDHDAIARWLAANGSRPLETTVDFEDGLAAFAKILPTSLLPPLLMMGPRTPREVLTDLEARVENARSEHLPALYAMWMAQLLDFEGDAPAARPPVPRPLIVDDDGHKNADHDAIVLVQREWLHAQGRNFYEILDLPADAEVAHIERAVLRLKNACGRDALGALPLGPARGLAEELWAVIDEIEQVLLKPDQRAAYDEERRAIEAPATSMLDIEADTRFLEARLALQNNDADEALVALEELAASYPDNGDYVTYLGWARYLSAARQVADALGMLKRSGYSHPQAFRPMLFLALAFERQGDIESAERFVIEAARRCPDDPEVTAALARIRRGPQGAAPPASDDG